MAGYRFRGLCGEYRESVEQYGEMHIPGRLLASIYYNLELLDLNRIEALVSGRDREGFLRILGAYAYGMNRLLAESDRNAMPLLLRLFQAGRGLLLEKLSLAPETEGMLFPASLNIEPYKGYLEAQEASIEGIVSLLLEAAKRIEENIINSPGGYRPDDRAYAALHLSRTLSEISRIMYSLSLTIDDSLEASGCEGAGHYCVLIHALRLADMVFEGASTPNVPVLGYIQATSTLTRTDLWTRSGVRDRIEAGLSMARRVLDEMSIEDLLKYDALSLEGSYYYNSGWLQATYEEYQAAGGLFEEAFRRFLYIEKEGRTVRLGFVRGALVSLWNYYLMWFDHDLATRGWIGEEKLEDAKCWGQETAKILLDPPTPGLVWKMGTHAFYACTLSVTASLLLGEKPSLDERIMAMAQERIRETIRFITLLLDGEPEEALRAAGRARLRPVIPRLLESWIKGTLGDWLLGRDPRSLAMEHGLTVREVPVLEYIMREAQAGGDPARGIALLALYTL